MRTKHAPTINQEIKNFPAFILDTKEDGDLGIVRAFVSIMGNIDHHMEVIVNGAFTKTIAERWQKIRVLDNHNFFSAEDAIAKLLTIREVGRAELPATLLAKYPDATGGLYIECQFLIKNETDKSYKIFQRIKNGFIDEYSIGFQIIKAEWREVNTDGGKRDIRFISEIKLFEVSPVIFAANDATATVDAKNNDIHAESQQDSDNDPSFVSPVEPLEDVPVKSDDIMPHKKVIPGYELSVADERCKNCSFYAAVTPKNGWCKAHEEAVNEQYICDSYEVMKAIETIGTVFKGALSEFMSKQLAKIMTLGVLTEDDEARLNEVLPVLVDNLIDLMPQDILGREIPNEEYQLPKSDDPEAEPNSDSLTSVEQSSDVLEDARLKADNLRKAKLAILKGGV